MQDNMANKENQNNTLDENYQRAQSGIQYTKDALQAARDLRSAMESAQAAGAGSTAGAAGTGASAAGTAAAAAGETAAYAGTSAAGGVAAGAGAGAVAGPAGAAVGAALAVAGAVVRSKTFQHLMIGLCLFLLLIPLLLAMIPNLAYSAINDTMRNMSSIIAMASEEAAAESTTWFGAQLTTAVKTIGYFKDFVLSRSEDNIMDEKDLGAVYDEEAALHSIKLKVQGTQTRVQRRTNELADSVRSIDPAILRQMCIEQSPDLNWDFSDGNSTVNQVVSVPAQFTEGSALRVVAAYGTQTQDASVTASVADFLNWVGTENITLQEAFTGIDAPWYGTFMPQPLYEEMQARKESVLGENYIYDRSTLEKIGVPEERILQAEAIETEYKPYQTALVNYLVVVEEPQVSTWEESRVQVETKTRTFHRILRDEEGTALHDPETGEVLVELVEEEYQEEREYSVACGMVTYAIQYMSTDALCDLVGFWEKGTGMWQERDNGPRVTKLSSGYNLTGSYVGEVSSDAAGVYTYLRSMGFSPAAACGILANIKQESGFDPHSIGDGGTSYGLCQWHNERWTRLRNWCQSNGLDETTVAGQCEYLVYELQTYYSDVWNYLTSVENTSQGSYDAAYYWCVHFEVPANKELRGAERGSLAVSTFWPEYGQTDNVQQGSSGEFYFDSSILMVEPDETYRGHVVNNLTAAEKGAIIAAINGEMGADLGGSMLIAQELRDAYDYFDYLNAGYAYWGEVTWKNIITTSFSPTYWASGSVMTDYSIYRNAYQAFQYVFEQGNSAVPHKLLGHAATYIDFSEGRPWWYRALYYAASIGEPGYVWSTELFGDYVNPNSDFTPPSGSGVSAIGGVRNVPFSKTYFEDHAYYFSDRFGFSDSPGGLLSQMRKAVSYGRDEDLKLLYQWDTSGGASYERRIAFQDDIYLDMLEYSAEYAGISLDLGSYGGSTRRRSGGGSMAQLAEQEFESYGGTACGNRYWGSRGPEAWCVDFVYWCANQLGYVGSGNIFGPQIAYVAGMASQLQTAGATFYYPGDGTVPQPGDIIMFWDTAGRPGTASDGIITDDRLCHTGIVVEGTSTTVTIVEGNCGSSNPASSVLKRNTYTFTGKCWTSSGYGDVYIAQFATPQYPSTGTLDASDHGAIQDVLKDILYGGASGVMISCDFDGYVNTPGRHEGIDVCRASGSSIYSLIDGEIIGLSRSSGMSAIFIYDAANGKTVCYLHSNFDSSLSVGQRISQGTYLGTEGSNGAAASHTHVEVLNGRATSARLSVLRSSYPVGSSQYYQAVTLENDDPYPYWASVLSS